MRLVRSELYSAGAALGLTLGRIPGVLVAVRQVRSLPVDIVRRDSSNLPARQTHPRPGDKRGIKPPLIAGRTSVTSAAARKPPTPWVQTP